MRCSKARSCICRSTGARSRSYLSSAVKVLGRPGFSFLGEWRSETGAVVEFDGEIDGIGINGVDMITVGDDGRITHFKVMVRPLKALNLLHRLMGRNWDRRSSSSGNAGYRRRRPPGI